MRQVAENGPQLRSRLESILNVPQRVRLRLLSPAALLETVLSRLTLIVTR